MDTNELILKELNAYCSNSLISHLGIEFIGFNDGVITAKMPVNKNTKQPIGILHGGASVALAETVGSVLSHISIDRNMYNAVGIEINANHVKAVSEGYVIATGKMIHRGRSTHVSEIRIETADGQLVSICRMTNMIIEKGFHKK